MLRDSLRSHLPSAVRRAGTSRPDGAWRSRLAGDRPAAAGDAAHRPRRGPSARDRRRVAALPHRGGRDRGRVRDGRRDRGRVRLVPAVRRPVRRAALHAGRRRSGGVAEPAPAAVRRHRHRSPGGAPGRARERRDPARRGVARAVPHQPHAGDRDERGGRPAGHRRGPPGRDPDGPHLARPDRRRVARSWSPIPASGPRPSHRIHVVLTRTPGDLPARWVQEHRPQDRPGDGPAGSRRRACTGSTIAAGDEPVGSIWATRARAEGIPDREETRLLSLAADQVGLAFRRERLVETANAAEIARQGEALKDALLDSVSHGFRTPLATIRAAAGSLLDPEVAWSDEQRRAAARTIDDGGRTTQRARAQPARHEPDRGGRAPPEPRGARRRRA